MGEDFCCSFTRVPRLGEHEHSFEREESSKHLSVIHTHHHQNEFPSVRFHTLHSKLQREREQELPCKQPQGCPERYVDQ